MDVKIVWFLFLLNVTWISRSSSAAARVNANSHSPCYAEDRRPQRCFPPFVNAAFNVLVEATNTCGFAGPDEFCQQTGVGGATKSCDVCDPDDSGKFHPSSYLTDFHSVDHLTWWQSSTMMEDIQWPRSVNLTISLGKAFEITYIRLKFFSSRPESFAIYKRTDIRSDWTPYQFYSASCELTYNMTSQSIITRETEGEAICKDEYSDISPLTGASVAFSTLEGRPRAYEFEKSPILQEWVTATDIRIVLNRINTFRDEVFGDPNVLRSYFYAISDFAIGARCKCNGHASECFRTEDDSRRGGGGRGEGRLICRCQHNTDGPDCERCLPFYNDLPWKRAISGHVIECRQCNCNGKSEKCYFNEELYQNTGHGGHCMDCLDNADGPNCERCREGFYKISSDQDVCHACRCHPVGSLSLQCDIYGRCTCKPGVTGDKCDHCLPEYYNLTQSGCSVCDCYIPGSLHNQPHCDSSSGACRCKEYVEGKHCDRCINGYFNLKSDNRLGCIPCFCFGHSVQCHPSSDYSQYLIHTTFLSHKEDWIGRTRTELKIKLNFVEKTQEITIASVDSNFVYFVFPDDYLGDQRFSYNELLTFNLRIEGDEPRASIEDIVIEGDGLRVTTPIFAQGNPMPTRVKQLFTFHLNEHVSYQWTPRLTSLEFVKMLSNLTLIKIRGSYTPEGIGYLSNVTLESANSRFDYDDDENSPSSVEQCVCPEGYIGQFCESCSASYYRAILYGGPFSPCIPCDCNGHSESCDLNTGQCICDHNTTGINCDRCLDGFYGYATAGTPDDCTQCSCPADGRCVELLNREVACIDCPLGHTGYRCDICDDGYHGDPIGIHGDPESCSQCMCNGNIDYNAVGNCNSTNGDCLLCVYNTAGSQCEYCLSGFYGDALSLLKGNCEDCECFPLGSSFESDDDWNIDGDQRVIQCDNVTGQCPCLTNVVGQRCDQCETGYWNIFSGSGCETCNCDEMGSINGSCDMTTGQCICKEGVSGVKCDQCIPHYYAFSQTGCSKCNCDPSGSVSLQCEITTGQCQCRSNVIGQQCNECARNKYNITAGCLDCPTCYKTVEESVDNAEGILEELRQIIKAIDETPPETFNNTDFLEKMFQTNETVYQLWLDAINSSDASLVDVYEGILSGIEDALKMSSDARLALDYAKRRNENAAFDATEAENTTVDMEIRLNEAEIYLREDGMLTLNKSIETLEEFGLKSDNMTAMATEVKLIAERLEGESSRAAGKADKALNVTEETLVLMRQAILKPGLVEEDIQQLIKGVNQSVDLFEETRNLSSNSNRFAFNIYNESVTIYSDVNSIQIPHFETESNERDATAINQTAADLMEELNQLLDKERQLMIDVGDLKINASVILEDARMKEKMLNDLAAEANYSKIIATDALAKAEAIVNDAQLALSTLKEFDDRVQTSKIEAIKALENLKEIEEFIEDAQNLTRVAVEKLADSDKDATDAQEIAGTAYKTANSVSQDVDSLKEETSIVKLRSHRLQTETEELKLNITELEERLSHLEGQSQQDKQLIEETLGKADEAKRGAEESSEKVSNALNNVNEILDHLATYLPIDIVVLDVLDRYLNSTKEILIRLNLDEKHETLIEIEVQMERWIDSYKTEMIRLRDDVDNIRHINETLPRDCFKKISLEPVDVSGQFSGNSNKSL